MNKLTTLPKLAKQINAEHALADAALREGLAHARNCGNLLVQAKEQLQHGEWLPWLAANVQFSGRTAQAYMRIANRWDELKAKAQGLADLTFESGLKLLATAGADRDALDLDKDSGPGEPSALEMAEVQHLLEDLARQPIPPQDEEASAWDEDSRRRYYFRLRVAGVLMDDTRWDRRNWSSFRKFYLLAGAYVRLLHEEPALPLK
jgi:hypothetical protein